MARLASPACSLAWNSTDPVIDYSEGFHTFGVELNATTMRFYTDNYTTSVRSVPTLCVTNPGFEWGSSRFMPWAPLYGILNVAGALWNGGGCGS